MVRKATGSDQRLDVNPLQNSRAASLLLFPPSYGLLHFSVPFDHEQMNYCSSYPLPARKSS